MHAFMEDTSEYTSGTLLDAIRQAQRDGIMFLLDEREPDYAFAVVTPAPNGELRLATFTTLNPNDPNFDPECEAQYSSGGASYFGSWAALGLELMEWHASDGTRFVPVE